MDIFVKMTTEEYASYVAHLEKEKTANEELRKSNSKCFSSYHSFFRSVCECLEFDDNSDNKRIVGIKDADHLSRALDFASDYIG